MNDLDAMWFGVHEFLEHEKTCATCSGETETGIVGRLKYLCEDGQRMLAGWSS